MKIDLLEAKTKFGQTFVVDMATKLSDDCFDHDLCKPTGLCAVKIQYVYADDGVHVKGEGTVPLEYYCTRCANPFSYELTFEFDELFKEKNDSNENDEDCSYFFSQDELILDDCLRDSVILATPQNLKCREDCKGVCPYCYANLNETECDCENNEEDCNPFSVLKQGL